MADPGLHHQVTYSGTSNFFRIKLKTKGHKMNEQQKYFNDLVIVSQWCLFILLSKTSGKQGKAFILHR